METASIFSWMAWTVPVAIFFTSIACMLFAMTMWELRAPTIARKGFLPLVTTRGDRLFIGLLLAAFVNLAWVGITDYPQWPAVAISALTAVAILRWG